MVRWLDRDASSDFAQKRRPKRTLTAGAAAEENRRKGHSIIEIGAPPGEHRADRLSHLHVVGWTGWGRGVVKKRCDRPHFYDMSKSEKV